MNPPSNAQRLVLGTAQFGMDYGATNAKGRVPPKTVAALLDEAHDAGIDTLDTAHAYGDAEDVIGAVLDGDARFRIVTKIAPLTNSQDPATDVARSFEASCAALRVTALYGVLIHDADRLSGDGGEASWEALAALKQAGNVRKVGVSVYTPEQAMRALDRFDIDLLQIPCSLADQRAIDSGLLDRCQACGTEVHTRSVFLQGVLAAMPEELPAHLSMFRPTLTRMHAMLARASLTPVEAAIGFVVNRPAVDRIVVGVTSHDELAQAIAAANKAAEPPDSGSFALDAPELLDPSVWPKPETVIYGGSVAH